MEVGIKVPDVPKSEGVKNSFDPGDLESIVLCIVNTDKRFVKDYEVYPGITVTFKTITDREKSLMNKRIQDLKNATKKLKQTEFFYDPSKPIKEGAQFNRSIEVEYVDDIDFGHEHDRIVLATHLHGVNELVFSTPDQALTYLNNTPSGFVDTIVSGVLNLWLALNKEAFSKFHNLF